MTTLNAKVLSVLKSQSYQTSDKSDGQNQGTLIEVWRIHLSYPGPETVYEIQLREPLQGLASKKYTVGFHGLVEFELFSDPHLAAGDSIQIDAYEPEEKSLG